MVEKKRYHARCAYESEKERRRRVTLRSFQHLYRSRSPFPSFAPFSSPPSSLFLSLSHASQHTLSPIMPVSLRPLSSHSLRLSVTLTTEQPQESMHPGSLLPAANDPTFQAFSFSLSPPSFSLSLFLSLPLCRSLSLSPLCLHPSSSDLRFCLHAQSTHASASIAD